MNKSDDEEISLLCLGYRGKDRAVKVTESNLVLDFI